MNTIRVALVLAAALAAALAANLVLLRVAERPNDPVGKLSPRAQLIRLPPHRNATSTTTSPTTTTVGATPRVRTSPSARTTRPHDDGGRARREQPDD